MDIHSIYENYVTFNTGNTTASTSYMNVRSINRNDANGILELTMFNQPTIKSDCTEGQYEALQTQYSDFWTRIDVSRESQGKGPYPR